MKKILFFLSCQLIFTTIFPHKPPDTKEKGDQVFFIVEEMPTFESGNQNKFRKYIHKNIKYPQEAIEKKICGKVFVYFIVDENGNVINERIVRGVHPSLDNEALRIIKNSPKWTPGKQRGEAVRVAFTFPVEFQLDECAGSWIVDP